MPAPTQDDLATLIVNRLKAHADVTAFVDDRVYGPGDTIPDPPTYPLIVVSHGTNHGAPAMAAGALSAADERIECRAVDEAGLDGMPTAVQAALNGYKTGAMVQCLLIDTGPNTDETTYWKRQDTFQVFFKG